MKKRLFSFISIILIAATLLAIIPVSAFAASNNTKSKYLPKYKGSSGSIVTALSSLEIDSSYSYRCKIAAANNISSYRGTANQNTKMLSLLKQGKLINPSYTKSSDSNESTKITNTANSQMYYPKYKGSSGSIVTALSSLGIDSSYSYRCKIAAANNISSYRGTANQNTKMLSLLKQGNLKRIDYVENNKKVIAYYNAKTNTTLRLEPYENSSPVCSVVKGSILFVLQSVRNSYGNNWYKVMLYTNKGVKEGYVYSGKITTHTHMYKSYEFYDITYKVCSCGDIKVIASTNAKYQDGIKVANAAAVSAPLATGLASGLGVVDGPFPVADLLGILVGVAATCLVHDMSISSVTEISTDLSIDDFNEYLKKKDNKCGNYTFRKVVRVKGKLKYVDKYCMDIVEAYLYVRLFAKDIYTPNEDAALLLSSCHTGGFTSIMERDKDKETYFFHYHLTFSKSLIREEAHENKLHAHIFFGTNDFGETPT